MNLNVNLNVNATLLLLVALCLPSLALAQESDPTPPAEQAAEEQPTHVETEVGEAEAATDPGFASGFVTRVEIDEATGEGRGLGDVLERAPGVYVQRTAGFGQPAYVGVRGGSPRQLVVTLEGIRLSAPAGLGFDVGSLAMAGFDAAHVYRGAAATVFGAGALTGAVDLRVGLDETPGIGGWAQAMAGSFGTYAVQARAEGATGPDAPTAESPDEPQWRGRIAAGWQRSEGDFTFVDAQGVAHTRVNNDHERMSVLGAAERASRDGRLSATVVYQAGESGAPGPSEFQEVWREARLDTDWLAAVGRWERRDVVGAAWGAIDAHLAAGFQQRQTDYQNPRALPGDFPVSDASTLRTFEGHAGADLWHDVGTVVGLDTLVRVESYEATHAADDLATTLSASRLTLGGALRDELFVGEAQAFSLLSGVRAEWIDDAPTAGGSAGGDARRWLPVLPAIGAIWRATGWLRLKANAARTFRAPDFDELYLDQVALRGDPTLDPERATVVDAGVQLGGDRHFVEAVYFHHRLDQTILFVAQNAWLFAAENLGEGTARGVELSGRAALGDALVVTGGYTYTDASLEAAPGLQTPNQPVHRARGRAAVDLARPLPVDAFVEAGWRSRVWLDRFGNLSNPPFWTLDAGAGWTPWPWLRVGVTAQNLTDSRRGQDFLQRPLPGRAFYGSVTVETR